MKNMDVIISRFPQLGENIFGNLNNESLANCKEVGKEWSNFFDKKKFFWIRQIRTYTDEGYEYHPASQFLLYNKFRESWTLVVQKTSAELIKQLATLLKDSLYKHENQTMYGDGYKVQKTSSELIKQVTNFLKDSLYKHENQTTYGDGYFFTGNKCTQKRLWSPLHIAVEAGNLDLCQFILGRTKIANPNDIEDWTPLHSAAKLGHFEICQSILKSIKSRNPPTISLKNPPTKSSKITPLHLAAQSG